MEEKKQTADWYIAATHWLTAGFVIPFLVNLVAIIIFTLLKIESLILTSFISIGLGILAIWLGVMYSANYLRKKYIIRDKNKIVKLATIYLFVLRIAFIIIRITERITTIEILLEVVVTIFVIVFFYLFSKKYIKESTENLVGQG